MPGTRSSAISGECRCSKNKIRLSAFFCCWLAFLFTLRAEHSPTAFLCNNNNNGDLWLFSANFIYGLRQCHSSSWRRHKLSALGLWSERGVWHKHLFTFPSLFPTETRVWEDMYDYVFLQHKARISLAEALFSVFCDDFIANSSICYEVWAQWWSVRLQLVAWAGVWSVPPQKAFLSLRAGLCHGLSSLDVAEPMALVLWLTSLKAFFHCQMLTMDAC